MYKNIILITITIFVMPVFQGCSGKHCVKIGGEYQGINGDLEYCFDNEKSKEVGVPVAKSESGDSFLLSREQVEKLGNVKDDENKKIGLKSNLSAEIIIKRLNK